MDTKTISVRIQALRAAGANNAMEGLYESAEDAAALDAVVLLLIRFARGEIDRAELDRRLRADLRAAQPREAHGA